MAERGSAIYGRSMRAGAGLHVGLTAAVLVAVSAISAGPAEALPAGCSQSGTTVTCIYTAAVETALPVPGNVGALIVHAVGAGGGTGTFGEPGGAGAVVDGTVAVSPGTTVFVRVGGRGANRDPIGLKPGGYNGGGAADAGASGGGASDIRTVANASTLSPDPRLIVAAGGGGAGGYGMNSGAGYVMGGNGGATGLAGGNGGNTLTYVGGKGGQPGAAGAGGAGGPGGTVPSGTPGAGGPGVAGTLGAGGAGNTTAGIENGGGGGGGRYGGGGGGSGASNGSYSGGGGGGGGSSLVPAGGSSSTAAAGTAASVTITYSTKSTVTGVTCTPNQFFLNQSTTCKATVTGETTPTGSVSFAGTGSFDASSCTLAATTTAGVAACSVKFTPSAAGYTTVDGTYAGDGTHTGSTGSATVGVTKRVTQTTVTCAPSTVVLNQASTCTASVKDSQVGTVTTPTGDVTFTGGAGNGTFSAPSCTLTQTATAGTAECAVTFTPSSLNGGTFTIFGTYPGDAAHFSSNDQTDLSVTARVTSTTVACDPASVVVAASTQCKATVTDTSGGTKSSPAGTVSLATNGSGAFSPGASCTLTAGTAGVSSCTVSYTPTDVGTSPHTITATYSGGGVHAGGSGTGTAGVAKRTSSLGVACVPATVVAGGASTCTVTATDTSPGTKIAPTGPTTLTNNAAFGTLSASSCDLQAGATAGTSSCSVTYTSKVPGTHGVAANYQGDGKHGGSIASTSVVVAQRVTSTALSCAGTFGTEVVCTAAVTDTSPAPATTPTGDVLMLVAGGLRTCTLAPADTAGTATCAVTYAPDPAASASDPVPASYQGDQLHSNSSASSVVAYGKRATGTAVACASGGPVIGTASVCTVTVADTGTGTKSAPTGQVAFSTSGSGAFSASSCTLAPGDGATSSCSVSFAPDAAGARAVTGTYGADDTHAGGSGSTTVTAVKRATTTAATCAPTAFGTASSCAVTVTDTAPGTKSSPTGTVAVAGRTCTLANGTCTVAVTPAAVGPQPVGATYGGDATHSGSTGGATLTVTPAASALKVLSSKLTPARKGCAVSPRKVTIARARCTQAKLAVAGTISPLAAGKVTVQLKGKVGRRTRRIRKTAKVAGGKWRASLKLPPSKRWTLTVSYAGTAQVSPATLRSTFRLKVKRRPR